MPRPLPPLALAYHGVADVALAVDHWRGFVTPWQLHRDIAVLRRWGYRLTTFGGLAVRAGAAEAEGWAAFTFDDGLADNLTALLPVLERTGAPATVFVVSGWLGGPHPDAPFAEILTADGVRQLHEAGVEIGAHTATHRSLPGLTEDAARGELERSRIELEDIIGSPVTVAAYPYGDADDRVRRACADAGFAAACRTDGEGSWNDPFDLPRQPMGNGGSVVGLWLKREHHFQRVMRLPPSRRLRRLSKRVHRWGDPVARRRHARAG